MFDPEFDPYHRLMALEHTIEQLGENYEEMSGQHVNNAWILEQMTIQMVEVSDAVNKMAEVIVDLRRRIKQLENTQ